MIVKRKFLSMTIILAHDPMEEKDKEQKNAFYDNLKAARRGRSDPLHIVTGDFNVQVIKEHVFAANVMKNSLHRDKMTTHGE
jgi:hypothetical protein